jgi:hypothetical protein
MKNNTIIGGPVKMFEALFPFFELIGLILDTGTHGIK